MAVSLPSNPSLERFRRDARRLQRAVRAHRSSARRRPRVRVRQLAAGADPELRDGTYDGTPLDWDEHRRQPGTTELLRSGTDSTR